MLSHLSKSYSAKGWLSVFTGQGARTSTGSRELRPDFKITDHGNRDSNRNQTPNSISSQSPLLESSLRVLVVESPSRLPNSSLKIPLTIPSEAWPKGYVSMICPGDEQFN
ncbi:hypothetical protein AVEN_1098-1 [Araneus ventricosus]|uniref:Uncharacterized protein n=1 Tax=Araneus ventricosus TaxID=182803 RepID=A0A4Y2N3Z2_ARAVE|nr:hypothetical protein AVEN_1098-1 [Araneus ventricosus]